MLASACPNGKLQKWFSLHPDYGMPKWHEHDPIYTLSMCTRAFWTNFSLSFPWKRLQWEKKIVLPCLYVIINVFFPRNIQWSSLFARKRRVNTERVPPGHPIILLKSNKFNMAAVLVKRSIVFTILLKTVSTAGKQVPLSSAEVRWGVIRFPLHEVSAGAKIEGPLPTAFLSLHSRHAPLGLYRGERGV